MSDYDQTTEAVPAKKIRRRATTKPMTPAERQNARYERMNERAAELAAEPVGYVLDAQTIIDAATEQATASDATPFDEPAPDAVDDETGDVILIDTDQFDLARHNATVTIQSPKTGDHRTFRIRTETWGNDPTPKRVVALLEGQDNEEDYRSFGFIGMDGSYPVIRVWKKYRGNGATRSAWEVYADMLKRPSAWEAKGCIYRIAGACSRCNRKLTHPESIDTGMGPHCRKIVLG